MARKAIRSLKLRNARRKVFIFKIVALAVSIVIIVGFLVLGFNSNKFKIQEIVVQGGHDFVNQEISSYSDGFLSRKYFGLIPKRNILLYPKWGLKKALLGNFPRVKEVSFELDPFKKQVLNIYVTEREEYALWCRNDDCYFLDRKGYVFDEAPVFFEDRDFRYGGGIESNPVGKVYLGLDEFKKIDALVKAFMVSPELSSFEISSLDYLGGGEYKVLSKNGSFILFNAGFGLEKVYENLVLAIEKSEIDLGNIEYIDIRLPGKVFYK